MANFTEESLAWHKVCDYYSNDISCPKRQGCYLTSHYLESDMTKHPLYEEKMEKEFIGFCTCNNFYGITGGPECDEATSGHAIAVATFAGLSLVFAVFLFLAYFATFYGFLTRSMATSKRVPITVASVTLTSGFAASAALIGFMYGSLSASTLIDYDWLWERYYIAYVIGFLTMFAVPTLLLVSCMWVEVILSSRKNMSSSKRQMIKATFRKGVVGLAAFVAILLFVLVLFGYAQYAASIMTVLEVLVFVSYGYGGYALSEMLGKSAAARGVERRRSSFDQINNVIMLTKRKAMKCFRGSKDTSVRMVVHVAYSLSLCALLNLVGVLLYVTRPISADTQDPVRSLGLLFAIFSVGLGLMFVLQYIRFGMRKLLGLNFEVEDTSDTKTAMTTSTSTEAVSPVQVAPAPQSKGTEEP